MTGIFLSIAHIFSSLVLVYAIIWFKKKEIEKLKETIAFLEKENEELDDELNNYSTAAREISDFLRRN